MNGKTKELPANAQWEGTTPVLTEKTVLGPMLSGHMTPKGKYGVLRVEEGSLQFVWEDTGETMTVSGGHSMLITPERMHHLKLSGPVKFLVEFYRVPGKEISAGKSCCCETPDRIPRPGTRFIGRRP